MKKVVSYPIQLATAENERFLLGWESKVYNKLTNKQHFWQQVKELPDGVYRFAFEPIGRSSAQNAYYWAIIGKLHTFLRVCGVNVNEASIHNQAKGVLIEYLSNHNEDADSFFEVITDLKGDVLFRELKSTSKFTVPQMAVFIELFLNEICREYEAHGFEVPNPADYERPTKNKKASELVVATGKKTTII